MDKKTLFLDRLKKLLLSQFEEVIFRLESVYSHIDKDIPTSPAPIAQRALALIERLDKEENGLEQLASAIAKVAPYLSQDH